jgi:integrase
LPKIDTFVADVQRRAKLRRTVEGSREGLSYSAAATYEGVLRDFKAWVTAEHPTMTTSGLDAHTLQTYVGYLAAGTASNGRRRGSATLNKHRAHLKTFVNWLAEQRPRLLQDPDLLRKALRPAVIPQREIQPYGPKELRDFHDALPPRARRLFKLICATGMRLSEAMTRTFDDLDFPSGRLTIRVASKTGKRRWVPLKETAPTLLKEMRKWERTDRLCGVNFYPRKDWEKAQKTVHITAQGIRRTFISVCIDFGIPAAIASQFLGHGIPVMERYYLMQIPRKRARSIQAAMGF